MDNYGRHKMSSDFYKDNDINEKYALQIIVIAMANFFLSEGDIEEVEDDTLVALKKAVETELETRQGTIH